jgi:CubicO group peptidase (beta-lactamase class C family)
VSSVIRHRVPAAAAALAVSLVVGLAAGTTVLASGVRASVAAPPARDAGVAGIIADYRTRIPELMAEQDIPGLALAVVDGERDQVVWQQGFGVTDEGGTPVTVDTIFSVQSMSKVFTATAVMQAVQAGLVALDEPITTYLPGFTVHSAFEPHPEREITLRMLLGHTAGFTHEAPLGNNYEPEAGTFDAHVRSISETWLRFPVGTGYAYSNLGIDLAGHILEQVSHRPFPLLMHESLLGPLGMARSTFERAQVHATADRAVGHEGGWASPPLDVPMAAAGGLWSSAADLSRFLRFELGDGQIGGRTVLEPSLMKQMRTVPAPDAGAPAGYALGIARTHWRAGQYLDLFAHGGGGYGFLSDLWFLPQLQLGIVVLTNSSDHDLQGTLALDILGDLANDPQSRFHDRMLRLPTQADVVEPDGHFVPPPDLGARIRSLALPASSEQVQRWDGYVGLYRTGEPGTMDPSDPPSRFHLKSGRPYFDAAEDGSPVLHSLTEVRTGVFLAEDGQTLDLRGPSPSWRGLHLHRVTGGPVTAQWVLLGLAAAVAAGWFVAGIAGLVVARLRRRGRRSTSTADPSLVRRRGWRRVTVAVGAAAALAALVTVAAIVMVPGLVDVGFLGRMPFPVLGRLLTHVPLALVGLTGGLVVLLAVGAARRWWTPRVRPGDAALAGVLTVLAVQLALWGLVGWGF